VPRCGLLGVEAFAVRGRFDPELRPQPAVPKAPAGRRRQLLLEARDPFKSGGRRSLASGGSVFHPSSLRTGVQPALFNRARPARNVMPRALFSNAQMCVSDWPQPSECEAIRAARHAWRPGAG
jgi:hypothetical protein